MSPARLGRCLVPAAALAGLAACATSGPAPSGRDCADFVPPVRISSASLPLPASYAAANVAGEVTDEIVVGRDGAVGPVRFVRAPYPMLAPFAEETLKRSRFKPASIQGNPVAARVQIATAIGTQGKTRGDIPYDSLRAFVPGTQPREAQWQLAGSVDRLTLVVRAGHPAPQGAAVVAIAPGGGEKTLRTLPASPAAQDVRETVKTGKFFFPAGEYRIELRAGGKALASTTVTIAARFEEAIVNACEPIPAR